MKFGRRRQQPTADKLASDKPAPARPVPARPTRYFAQFFEHAKSLGFQPATCIDVGAASGTGVIYEAFPDAMHLAFEPLPEFQDRLRENLQRYRHRIFPVSLMDRPGEKTILRTGDAFGSSMMHKLPDDRSNVLPVEVDTLDNVLSELDLEEPLFLKTDCQGADLFVVKGGLQTLKRCDLVIMEVSFFKFWGPHHPDFHEIVHFMKEEGFVVYDLLDGLFRPRDRALGQIDVVFVKEEGLFRTSHRWG